LAGLSLTAVAQAQSVFTVYKTGGFYHMNSTLPHAYDLLADSMRTDAESDALKDFSATDAGSFEGAWKAGNSTAFVRAPGWPAFNAQTGSVDFTFAKIDSIYKAGTPITLQADAGTGSKHVYIAKIRGSSTYVIVKFLSIIGNNNDCACAKMGKAGFEYWKMAAEAGPVGIKPVLSGAKQALERNSGAGFINVLGRPVEGAATLRIIPLNGR
jgi:hypothetical protein